MQSVADTQPDSWRHVAITWEIAGNTVNADRYVNSIDLVNITNGQIDSSWTQTDYSNVHAEIALLCAAWLARCTANVKCLDVKYYKRQFNPLSNPKPYAPSGPPEFTVAINQVGTVAGAPQVPQVAMTHTEKTPYARHWGRSYWPMPAPGTLTTATSRFSAAIVDGWAAELGNRFGALQTKEFFPVVPVIQVQKNPARGLLAVEHIQVDDIPDVIRRRRFRMPTHRATFP